ncbi:MAG: Ppx/GppA phosphatase family protein [Ignavibacteriaceae bacterium]
MSLLHKKNIAAIDMGTNSFHLIIVEADQKENFKIIDREKEVMRLASHEGKNLSFITEEETKKAILILKKFIKLSNKYNADIRAVATSAVREAKNKDEFIKKIFDQTDLKIEAINGKNEAELIFLGAQKALPLFNKKVLCIDIGGGSTEFILNDNGKFIFSESIKIGAVRLTKKFFPNYELNESNIVDCENYIEEILYSNKMLNFNSKFDLAIGTSGTIQAAASMIYYSNQKKNLKKINGFSFSCDDFYQLSELILSKKTVNERKRIPGMESKRADVIPAGILILKKAFQLFKLRNITISEYALREGIVIDTIRKSN